MDETPVVYAQPFNRDFVEGKRRRIEGPSGQEWALVILVIAIIGITVWGAGEQGKTKDILRQGIDAEAHVVSQRVVSGRSKSYYVTYEYAVGGQVYQREELVGLSADTMPPVGMVITVRYLPSDPANARMFQPAPATQPVDLLLLCIIPGVGLAALPFVSLWRSRRLVRRGKLISGTLLSSDILSFPYTNRMSFEYTFQTPTGKKITGRRSPLRNGIKRAQLPPAGSPVKVLYVDDDTHRML